MFGGNSNWRGPVRRPPTTSRSASSQPTITSSAKPSPSSTRPARGRSGPFGEIAARPRRQDRVHLAPRPRTDAAPSLAPTDRIQDDPAWSDNLLFYEYFHGDNGAGLGGNAPDRLDRARRRPDPRPAEPGDPAVRRVARPQATRPTTMIIVRGWGSPPTWPKPRAPVHGRRWRCSTHGDGWPTPPLEVGQRTIPL